MADGHSAGQIVLQLHDRVVLSESLSDRQKSAICERLAVSGLHQSYSVVSGIIVYTERSHKCLWMEYLARPNVHHRPKRTLGGRT